MNGVEPSDDSDERALPRDRVPASRRRSFLFAEAAWRNTRRLPFRCNDRVDLWIGLLAVPAIHIIPAPGLASQPTGLDDGQVQALAQRLRTKSSVLEEGDRLIP